MAYITKSAFTGIGNKYGETQYENRTTSLERRVVRSFVSVLRSSSHPCTLSLPLFGQPADPAALLDAPWGSDPALKPRSNLRAQLQHSSAHSRSWSRGERPALKIARGHLTFSPASPLPPHAQATAPSTLSLPFPLSRLGTHAKIKIVFPTWIDRHVKNSQV